MPDGHIANYAELQTSIADTLARSDLDAYIPEWIALTELSLFRDCDVKDGDQVTAGLLLAGSNEIVIPTSGVLDVKLINLLSSPERQLSVASIDRVFKERDTTTQTTTTPAYYTVVGGRILIGPNVGDSDVAYVMYYYGKPLPISDENPTNELLVLGADAYLYGALRHSAPFLGDDERVPMWNDYYSTMKASLKKAYWRSRLSGPLQTRPDFVVNDQHKSGLATA